jgi:hypothetical protein
VSLNNLPNNLPSVERILQRVSAAERSQQKEIRITVQEARELAAELSIITTRLGKTVSEIHAMLSEIKENNTGGTTRFDGGGFN